jgi:hypothetical protein
MKKWKKYITNLGYEIIKIDYGNPVWESLLSSYYYINSISIAKESDYEKFMNFRAANQAAIDCGGAYGQFCWISNIDVLINTRKKYPDYQFESPRNGCSDVTLLRKRDWTIPDIEKFIPYFPEYKYILKDEMWEMVNKDNFPWIDKYLEMFNDYNFVENVI